MPDDTDLPAAGRALLDERLAHLIGEAARGFTFALQVRLELQGVPVGHWKFLRILWDSDGLTQRELSARTGLTPATTSAAIKGMEALGYVVLVQLPTNKKNVYVYLTPSGRGLKTELVPLAEEINRMCVAGLTESDIATTKKALVQILENLNRDNDSASGLGMRTPSTREIGQRLRGNAVGQAGKA